MYLFENFQFANLIWNISWKLSVNIQSSSLQTAQRVFMADNVSRYYLVITPLLHNLSRYQSKMLALLNFTISKLMHAIFHNFGCWYVFFLLKMHPHLINRVILAFFFNSKERFMNINKKERDKYSASWLFILCCLRLKLIC